MINKSFLVNLLLAISVLYQKTIEPRTVLFNDEYKSTHIKQKFLYIYKICVVVVVLSQFI